MNRTNIAATLAAALACLAAPHALAQEPAVEIYYGDLDVSSEAGRKALEQRVQNGVTLVCGPANTRDIKIAMVRKECSDAVMAEVAEQLPGPAGSARRAAAQPSQIAAPEAGRLSA